MGSDSLKMKRRDRGADQRQGPPQERGLLVKRLLDVAAASGLLLLLSPALGVIALLVRRELGSPVLFRQTRPGKHGKPFELLKFRTMLECQDASGHPLPDSHRLTRFGRWLRATSVDELPGLWNVLRGDMSLVGPRPLLLEYLPLYTPEQARRHDVLPGITGWAQVNGRNAISWEEKFELDIWYVENRSAWLDVKILARTAACVFLRRGVNAQDAATMPKFEGKK